MDRLVWAVVPCLVFAGCQAPKPNFDPFAMTGQTRVPAPATGAVGQPGSYLPASAGPLPPLNTGNSGAPGWSEPNSLAPQPQLPSPTVQPPPLGRTDPEAARGLAHLRPAEQLAWRDGSDPSATGPAVLHEDPSVVSYASALQGQNRAGPLEESPRTLPDPGPHERLTASSQTLPPPVSTPPRIRGFVNSGVREVRIPATLAEFSEDGIRQSDATSNRWQARYGTPR